MSVRLRLDGVDFAYGGGDLLLRSACLDLHAGVWAIAGPNGAGKSTLLGLLAGTLSPTRGQRSAKGVVRFLGQDLDVPGTDVEAFGQRWDRRALALRSRLQTPELGDWQQSSPGQRRRLQLAAVFCDEDAIVLLDEPTTHLDAEGRQVLRGCIEAHRGLVVFVSHNRAFIDELADHTLWVESREVAAHRGGYSALRDTQERQRQSQHRSHRRARKDARRLVQAHAAQQAQARQAGAQISKRSRIKGPKDSDAREAGRKGKAAKAAASLSQRSGALGARKTQALKTLQQSRQPKSLGGAVQLRGDVQGSSFALRLELPEVAFGERVVLQAQCLGVPRGAKIRLHGANGAGKSTLLREMASAWKGEPAGLVHLRQEQPIALRRQLRNDLEALAPDVRGQVLTLIAALGVDPKALLRATLPSPGQAHKLLLAMALRKAPRLLLLDEPEGGLDAPSREHLEDALEHYAGAMVLVTHDATMAKRLTDECWTLKNGWVVS